MIYTLSNIKNKVISASLITISLLISGCYGKNIDPNELETIFYKNSERANVSSETMTHDTSSTENVTSANDTVETITSSTSEEQVFSPSADDCRDFYEYYIQEQGVNEESLSASTSQLKCFLYDDYMNKSFVDFYNERYGTSFPEISRLELIEFLNGFTGRSRSKSEYYPVNEDLLDDVANGLYDLQYKEFIQINCFTDEILLSYMAENNLPLGHIFSYEEISLYIPDLKHSDDWTSYNVYIDNYSNITKNSSANKYLGYAMMVHNSCLNEFTLDSWIDTETFTGQYADLYRDRVNQIISDHFKNELGVNVNIEMEDVLTPEIYEEIYGHEIYDLSPESIDGYTAEEFAKTH